MDKKRGKERGGVRRGRGAEKTEGRGGGVERRRRRSLAEMERRGWEKREMGTHEEVQGERHRRREG